MAAEPLELGGGTQLLGTSALGAWHPMSFLGGAPLGNLWSLDLTTQGAVFPWPVSPAHGLSCVLAQAAVSSLRDDGMWLMFFMRTAASPVFWTARGVVTEARNGGLCDVNGSLFRERSCERVGTLHGSLFRHSVCLSRHARVS